MPELWTEKHAPNNWGEFIGNQNVVLRVRQWAEAWQNGKRQKPLFLYGPVGNGKTTLALLCAKMFGWQLFEMNASDSRTRDIIEKLAGAASQGASFSGGLRLILLDEVDGLQAQDRGGAEAIAKILKETKNPIILTANDIYANRKLASIRAYSEPLEMRRVHVVQIAKLLQKICLAENVPFEKEAITLLAKRSGGDVRAAILDLQTVATQGKLTVEYVNELSYREREENIFTTVATIMRAKNFSQVRIARAKADVDSDLLNAWISENIPRQFDAKDTAKAFNYISKADVFEGRIMKRQYYGLKRYSYDLATACAVLSRSRDYSGWVRYQFPKIIKELSASRQQRAIRQSLCKKVGKVINASATSVSRYELPLIKLLFTKQGTAVALTALFGFDEKEIAFLLGKAKAEKTAEKIKKLAEELHRQHISTKIVKMKNAGSKNVQSKL